MLIKGSNLKADGELDKFSQFLHQYGGLDFTKVKFRPGSSFTTDFGMDNTFNELRFHPAIDRGSATTKIYAPFDLTHISLNLAGESVWGIQLLLHTAYGFEIRIAHIEDLPDDLMKTIKNKSSVKSGTYLCEAGNAGKSTGTHTHVEIVSYEKKSSFLEEILFLKYPKEVKQGYNLNSIVTFLYKENLKENATEAYTRELKKKRISFINNHLCRRIDYYNNSKSTFYSSKSLFGM